MTIDAIKQILGQARDLGTVKRVYFEGGEPFQFYAVLLSGVRAARRMGFEVGVVSNAYWAVGPSDAIEYLGPLAGLIDDFTISADWFHWSPDLRLNVTNACRAARELGIPFNIICILCPEWLGSDCELDDIKVEQAPLMYRGRAAARLGPDVPKLPWRSFKSCDHEDLGDPNRVHVDPFGYVHICQGISIGNVFSNSLSNICEEYEPESHPIVGPLLEGGPVELALRYGLDHRAEYADACHACYDMRLALRGRFPDILTPNQMYGVHPELDPLEALATK